MEIAVLWTFGYWNFEIIIYYVYYVLKFFCDHEFIATLG